MFLVLSRAWTKEINLSPHVNFMPYRDSEYYLKLLLCYYLSDNMLRVLVDGSSLLCH